MSRDQVGFTYDSDEETPEVTRFIRLGPDCAMCETMEDWVVPADVEELCAIHLHELAREMTRRGCTVEPIRGRDA